MPQTSDQLLQWATAELPALKARLAATHAAVAQAQRMRQGSSSSAVGAKSAV